MSQKASETNTYGNFERNISFVAELKLSGNLISKVTTRSPFLLGSLGYGNPCPLILRSVFGLTISSLYRIGMVFPSRVGTSRENPHNACLRVIWASYLMSLPSRLKIGWLLSLIMNIMSAGILWWCWSPSLGNVIFVPAFQPRFTSEKNRVDKFRKNKEVIII